MSEPTPLFLFTRPRNLHPKPGDLPNEYPNWEITKKDGLGRSMTSSTTALTESGLKDVPRDAAGNPAIWTPTPGSQDGKFLLVAFILFIVFLTFWPLFFLYLIFHVTVKLFK